ncbi:hypothetical protein [Ruegeria sp.]|uniref:hypothetical protein n=1 Tax=Ruegeria sp. TaxID=1879320 RepID=UPI003C7C6831
MTFLTIWKRLLPERPSVTRLRANLKPASRMCGSKQTSQTELVELFGADLRAHASLREPENQVRTLETQE